MRTRNLFRLIGLIGLMGLMGLSGCRMPGVDQYEHRQPAGAVQTLPGWEEGQ